MQGRLSAKFYRSLAELAQLLSCWKKIATTSYTYDLNCRMTSTTDAEGRTFQYEYDPNGNLVKLTDPRGNETEWTYDVMNRKTKKKYADGRKEHYVYQTVPCSASGFESEIGDMILKEWKWGMKWGQATNLDWTEMNRKKHQKILTENTKRITVL